MTSRVALVSLGTLLLTIGDPARAWVVDDDPGRALAVAVDGNDDVAAAGRLDATDNDALVVKLDGTDGTELWRRAVDGSGGGDDVARAVAVAGNGDVIAAGGATGSTTSADALVCRLAAADGTEVWQVVRDGGASAFDTANDVAIDGNGDVLVAGRATLTVEAQLSVLKLDGETGAEAWQTGLPGVGTATSVAVDPTDAVVAAGSVGPLMTVTKLTSGGAVTWQTDVMGDASADDLARSLALDGTQAVVVAGYMTTDAGARDFAVVSLDATDGMENWRYVLDGAAGPLADADSARDVLVDSTGDVFAVGHLSNLSGSDVVAVKLDGATGAEIWRTTINGTANDVDEALAVALVGTDIVLVGRVGNAATRQDALVVRLDGATGDETWRREIEGGNGENDRAVAVAVDGAGDVVVGGRPRNEPDVRRFAVLKLSGATGGDFPCGDAVVDAGEECDDGNTALGDGCRPNCTEERCGDGIVDPQEECDGGAGTAPCCTATCTAIPDQGSCDDGDACTESDVCVARTCTGSPIVCGACETCDSATGCVPNMLGACRVSARSKTLFVLKDKSTDAKDQLRWKWKKGEFTDGADFGDPTTTDDFTFCLFDRSSATPALLAGMTMPAGVGWKPKNNKVRYKDKTGTPDGIRSAHVKAGNFTKSKASVSGKGENLPMPSLPLPLPVTAQLQAATGKCWETTYGEDDARKNTEALFKAKGGR